MNSIIDDRLEGTLEDQIPELFLEIIRLTLSQMQIGLLDLLLFLRKNVDGADRLHKDIEIVEVVFNFFFNFILLILCLL